MKKAILSILSLLVICCAFAQNGNSTTDKVITSSDKVYKHSGEVLDVKVLKVGEFTVSYKYPGEDGTGNKQIGCW